MSMNAVAQWVYNYDLKPLSGMYVPKSDLSPRKGSKGRIWCTGFPWQARISQLELLGSAGESHFKEGAKRGVAGVSRVSLVGKVYSGLSLSWPGLGTTATGVAAAAAVGTLLFMTTASQRDPHKAMLATREGMHLFVEGDVSGSIKKFDEALDLDSRHLPYLWQRGLSFYYVDRFEDGAKQFRDDVAANPNDTEESIWCFLCEAQLYGVDEARRRFLDVGPDSRPIMAKVYNLFRHGGSFDELVQSVENKDGADYFYATLYAGLYHEAHKQSDAAREAILASHRSKYGSSSNDYMAALARVHAECRGWIPSN